MTLRYFIAPDGNGDETLWEDTGREPRAICTRHETDVVVWQHIVLRVKGLA